MEIEYVESKTKGGIYIPQEYKDENDLKEYEVTHIGESVPKNSIEIGDVVLINGKYPNVSYEGETYKHVPFISIMAVVTKEE